MSYVRSSELNNDYQTPDGESLPAYTSTGPTLSPEALSLANAAVLAAHEEHNNPAGPTAAETIESLFESIHSTSDAAVAHLLSNFPNHINPNSRNHNGKTALAAAVETGNIRMVEMLINMGADVDAWSVQGEYDLHKYYYNKPWFGKLRAGGRSRPNPRRRGNPGQGGDEYPYTLQPAYQILRTPLMIASERGYLPIVKLLFNPPCNADHKLCAPDGQIALRLAVERNHREIVDFLPSVRKGGFRRFKHQHATSTYRIKQTTEVARIIAKAILYEVPKALLYRLPKWTAKKLWKLALHVITVAIPATAKAIWGGMVKCGQYVKNDLPKAVANQGKAAGKGLKKLFTVHIPNAIKSVARFFWNLFTKVIPDAITCTAKFIWRLFTHHIPHAIKKTAIFIWDLITDYLPRAIVSVGKGVWKTIKFIAWVIMKIVTSWFPAFCESVVEQLEEFATDSWDLFLRGVMAIVSLLHTIFEALASFFRRISLRDIWNGFVQVLRWVFLEVPTGIGKVLLKVYKAFVKGMETVFGWWGKAIVFLWECVVYMIVYFPVKLGGAMVEYGKVLVRGAKEVLVWFDPKK